MRNVYKRYEKEVKLTHADFNDGNIIHTYVANGPYRGKENSTRLANKLIKALAEEEGLYSSELENEIRGYITKGKDYRYDGEKQLHLKVDLGDGFELETKMYVVEERETFYPSEPKKVLRPMEEFNGYTPQDSLDYIKSLIDPFESNDERLSDAIKRLQVLIDEAK